jgi:hypothetical protein
MIVRISGEDQYRLSGEQNGDLHELDHAVIAAVERGDEAGFHAAYETLLRYVRERGERMGDEELEGSDLILPPTDITLAEAASEFSGEGLIPD